MTPSLLSVFPRLRKFACLLLGIVLLQSCTPVPPDTVVRDFWAAALMGDKQTVASLALSTNFDAQHFDAALYHELFDYAVVGEVDPGSRQARVSTRLEGYLQSIEFDTITTIHEGRWQVDYLATTQEMIAALLAERTSEIDMEIQEDLKAPDSDLGTEIREGWRNFDQHYQYD